MKRWTASEDRVVSREGISLERGQDLRMQAPATRQRDHGDYVIAMGCCGGAWRNAFNVCGRRPGKLMAENGVVCGRFGPPACRQLV